MAINRESTIQHLYSGTGGVQPTPTDLEYGELAINTADGKVFFRGSDDSLKVLLSSGDVVTSINGETGDYTDLTPFTGILGGGVISGTLGGTTFDVSAGIGQIVGITTGVAGVTMTRTEVTWDAFTNVSPTYLATNDFSRVYIDSSGNLQQQTAPFTHDDYVDKIVLGTISHIDQSSIALITNKQNAVFQSGHRLFDLINVFGPMKKSGLVVSANGANLSLDRSSGEVFWIGSNYSQDQIDPDLEEITAETAADIARIYRDGSGDYIYDTNSGSFYTVVDPANYDDDSGTLQTVNNNQWTVQRMYMFPNLTNVIMLYYGIAIYNSFSDAIEGIQTESFQEADITEDNAVFLGYLVVRGGAADLTTTDDAKFISSGFSRVSGAGGGGGGAGAVGATGATGATGPQGEQGVQGPTGATGPQGEQGIQGNTGTFTVYYSSSAPSSPTVGDIWFHSDDGVYSIYVNDGDSDQWIEITGKQGPTGENGVTGSVGVTGPTGPAGEGGGVTVVGSTGATTDSMFYDTDSSVFVNSQNFQLTPNGIPFFTQFGETIYDWGGVTTGSTFEIDLSNGMIQHINVGPTGGAGDGSTKTFSFTGENGSIVENVMLVIRGGGGYTMDFNSVTWNDEAGEPAFGATSGIWTFVPFTYIPIDGLGWVGGAQMTVVQ